MTTIFRASSDRKVAPYGRKRGKSANGMAPLKNSFGLPACLLYTSPSPRDS